MDCALAYTSAKNHQRIEEYKNILSSIISSNDIVDAKGFIDHILSDDVPLAISKPLLRTFAEDLGKFEADNLKEIAEYTLLKIAPLGRLKEQAEFIASKMNCGDGMRGSIDKDIEVSRGMHKRRRVEAIPGSEERGSKDYEVGKDLGGTFEVLKRSRKDYEVGKDWDGPIQVLKGSNDLSGRKLYEVWDDWDGSIQVLKGRIDLYGRKEYEALEGSVEVLNVENLKRSNDIVYEVGDDWDGSIQVLKGRIDLYGRKEYEALEGSVEVLNVKDLKRSNDIVYEVGDDWDGSIQVLKGCIDLYGRKDYEALEGSVEVLNVKDLKRSNDIVYEVGDDWDGSIQVLKGCIDLYGRKEYEALEGSVEVLNVKDLKRSNDIVYEVGDDWDGSIQVLKGCIDLYGRKDYEALEGSVEVLNVKDLKRSNDIVYEVGDDWDGSIQVLKGCIDLYGRKEYEALEGSVEVLNVKDLKGSNDLSGRKLYEVGKDGIQVLKSGCDMDYTDESEMKCDSEGLNAAKGSNEMAGGFLSWGQSRKARCSRPFVVGSVKLKRLELGTTGKLIPFDVDRIDVIDSDTPMFILVVETRSVAQDLYHALVRRGYRCIIVATMSKSLKGSTLESVYKLQKMSKLQVYALFDCSPHFNKMMSDLIIRNEVDLIWLGIRLFDVWQLRNYGTIEPEILMTDTEQNQNLLAEQLCYNVPVKAFPAHILIDYYLPKLLTHSGVPGAD